MSIKSRHQTSLVLGAALASALLASGCSSVGNVLSGDKLDYRTSGAKTVVLDVPPDLSQLPGQTRYGQQSPSSVTATSLGGRVDQRADIPTQVVAPQSTGVVKLERQGQIRWLTVNLPPEKIWDQVREFWQEAGFELSTDKPELGLLETNWSENRAKLPQDGIRRVLGRVLDGLYDTGERDQFRTRVERTAQGSEIYITHRGLIEVYEDAQKKEQTKWRPRAADPSLEAEMLSRLMAKLGAPKEVALAAKSAATTVNNAASSAASTNPQTLRARLNADSVSLNVDDDVDTTWRRVGLALDRGGFTIEGRDRKTGAYEVRLSTSDEAQEKPGFFSRLFSSSSDKTARLARYRVQVGKGAAGSVVSVQDDAGKPANSDTGRRIAKQLLDELI